MRLTLELISGTNAGAARVIDGSHRFSVGTQPGSTWVLPESGTTPAQVRIQPSQGGFAIEADGDVSLEGQPIGDGASRQLGHNSVIKIANVELRATLDQSVTNAYDTTSSAVPTISSILSDVAPGGGTAQGPIPGRTGEDWLDEMTQGVEKAPPVDWAQVEAFGGSANTNVSPLGPPPTEKAAPNLSTFLPDDWHAPGDAQNKVTQASSPSETTTVSHASGVPPKQPKEMIPSAVKAFLKSAEILPEEIEGPLENHMALMGDVLRSLLEGVGKIEVEQMRFLTEVDGVEAEGLEQASAELFLGGGDPRLVLAAVRARLNRVVMTENAIATAMIEYLAKARDALDPQIVEAAAAKNSGLRARMSPDSAAWAEYRRRWGGEDAPLAQTSLSQLLRDKLNENMNTE